VMKQYAVVDTGNRECWNCIQTVSDETVCSCGYRKPRVLKRYTNCECWNSMQFWIQETESSEKVYNRGYWKLWLAWIGVNLGMLKTMTHEISCQYYQLQDKPSLVVDIYISDTNRIQSMFRFPINRFPGIFKRYARNALLVTPFPLPYLTFCSTLYVQLRTVKYI
jgi:hypothetical protein